MKRNLILMAAATLAVGLIAAGCGSDSGNDDASSDTGTEASTSDSLTSADFLAQANAICNEGNKAIDTSADETFSGGKPTPAEEDAFVNDTVVPNVQGQIDDIRALGVPDDLEEQVNGPLDDAEAILDDLRADPSAIEGDPFAPINKDLKAAGLTTCAS